MSSRRELVYPVFLECSSLCKDPFWQNIFEELAYSKPPYGIYFSKGYLCCAYKGKEFTYKIESKPAEIITDEIYNLLSKKIGMLSSIEKIRNRQIFSEMEQNIQQSRTCWSSIKKKTTKDLLVELYVTRMQIEHNLNIVQTRYLHSVILNALTFKTLNSNDIVYKDGVIKEIKGIDFVNEQVVLLKNFHRIDTNFGVVLPSNTKTMQENWEKFIENLKKNMIKPKSSKKEIISLD